MQGPLTVADIAAYFLGRGRPSYTNRVKHSPPLRQLAHSIVVSTETKGGI
jgi:hypothetical protein